MNLLKSKLYQKDIDIITSQLDIKAFSKCTFLITGGLGLICSAIVDLLIRYENKNHIEIKIIVAARSEERFLEKYGTYSFVEYMPYDAEKEFVCDKEIDYIIHGAGLSSPEKYTNEPVETMLSNINGIVNILEYGKCHNVKKILYISSSEVYGTKDKEDAFIENDYGYVNLDSIRSSYPIAKRSSEMLCRSYAKEYGVKATIARPGHVFGPSASELDNRISSVFAYKAAKGEELELKSSGIQKRSYLYSLDCAKAILLLLLKGKKGEAYNVGNEKSITIKELAECYAHVGNVPLIVAKPTEEETKAFNPMDNSTLSIEKIKELGYKDTFDVRDALKHTVDILKEIIDWYGDILCLT